MDRDHKYSGTLPLLAYAPQDFGLNAQRSRAYRARAAMGRTGVQPLRSHVQAAPVVTKAPVVEVQPAQSSSLFAKLWLRASKLFSKPQKAETTSDASPSVVVITRKAAVAVIQENSVSRPQILNRKPVVEQIVAEQSVMAETIADQEILVETVTVAQVTQPVSKTYASMRMSNVAAVVSDETIPQAPDLAHALAEIRQALREHEKLANAKQRDMSL